MVVTVLYVLRRVANLQHARSQNTGFVADVVQNQTKGISVCIMDFEQERTPARSELNTASFKRIYRHDLSPLPIIPPFGNKAPYTGTGKASAPQGTDWESHKADESGTARGMRRTEGK